VLGVWYGGSKVNDLFERFFTCRNKKEKTREHGTLSWKRKSGEDIECNDLLGRATDTFVRVMRTLWGMYTAIAESGNT
jgi:hypothetical protein